MKQFLNTLFITTQDTYLFKEGESVAIKQEGKIKAKIPAHTLGGLVIFGQVSCSPYLLSHCAKKGIAVTWLGINGRFLATMNGPISGNVLLRKEQYRKSDDSLASAKLARSFCIGKIFNCRTILRRTAREYPSEDLHTACTRLTWSLEQLKKSQSLDTIRGIEGEAASVYFKVFQQLIREKKSEFQFKGRSRRPPLDEVNCLLSFFYTLLVHDARSALEAVGLDSSVGFLHRDRPGRPSLALDLMEEFRPYLVDRLVCTLINRGQIKIQQFKKSASGAVLMDEELKKTALAAWQSRKKEIIEHPFLKEKMSVGLLLHMQARLLARTIRGDQSIYPPFTVR